MSRTLQEAADHLLGREKFADDLDESAVSRESTAMADIEGYLRKIQGTLKMMKRGKGRNARANSEARQRGGEGLTP
jgi:hypothetical protein